MGLWALQRQEEPIHSEHFLDATVIGLLLDQGGSVPRAVAATGEPGSVSPKANDVTGMCVFRPQHVDSLSAVCCS